MPDERAYGGAPMGQRMWPGGPPRGPWLPGSSGRLTRRPTHARRAEGRAPHLHCTATLPPRRLKVTYEAPTRTRAKVQQSIDARSARLVLQSLQPRTAHALTTRDHATRSHATRSRAALEYLTRARGPSVLGRGRRLTPTLALALP